MKFEHVIDLTLHIGSFRNFELMYTGAYRLRARAFWEEEKNIHYALPYIVVNGASGSSSAGFFELCEGFIESKDSSFYSNSFYIDYSEVFKEINQIVIFRYTFEGDVPEEIFVEFQLSMLQQTAVRVGLIRIKKGLRRRNLARYRILR